MSSYLSIVCLLAAYLIKGVSALACNYYPNYPDNVISFRVSCPEDCCSGYPTSSQTVCCTQNGTPQEPTKGDYINNYNYNYWWISVPVVTIIMCCGTLCIIWALCLIRRKQIIRRLNQSGVFPRDMEIYNISDATNGIDNSLFRSSPSMSSIPAYTTTSNSNNNNNNKMESSQMEPPKYSELPEQYRNTSASAINNTPLGSEATTSRNADGQPVDGGGPFIVPEHLTQSKVTKEAPSVATSSPSHRMNASSLEASMRQEGAAMTSAAAASAKPFLSSSLIIEKKSSSEERPKSEISTISAPATPTMSRKQQQLQETTLSTRSLNTKAAPTEVKAVTANQNSSK